MQGGSLSLFEREIETRYSVDLKMNVLHTKIIISS